MTARLFLLMSRTSLCLKLYARSNRILNPTLGYCLFLHHPLLSPLVSPMVPRPMQSPGPVQQPQRSRLICLSETVHLPSPVVHLDRPQVCSIHPALLLHQHRHCYLLAQLIRFLATSSKPSTTRRQRTAPTSSGHRVMCMIRCFRHSSTVNATVSHLSHFYVLLPVQYRDTYIRLCPGQDQRELVEPEHTHTLQERT